MWTGCGLSGENRGILGTGRNVTWDHQFKFSDLSDFESEVNVFSEKIYKIFLKQMSSVRSPCGQEVCRIPGFFLGREIMAKKKKNRVRNLDNSGAEKSTKAGWLQHARFELEENAEQLFLDAVEKLSPQAIAEKESAAKKSMEVRSGSPKEKSRSVDLHGLTLSEAQSKVKNTIDCLLAARGDDFSLRIVTGKGIHSGPGGGVLAREIHEFVRLRFSEAILEMTDSPASVSLSGVPLRGYFDVKFRARFHRG